MKWSNVTLRQFLELQKLLQIEDENERLISIAELFLGDEVNNLPIPEFAKKVKELDFLKEEIPNTLIVKSIKVNGREYTIDAVLGHITTAQYIDYQNWMKQENNYAGVLSVFFIPKGHKYNDGYDIEEVLKDMLELPIDVVCSECFFFSRQLHRFIQIFQSSSVKKIQSMKIPKEKKESMIKMITNSFNLASSLSFSNSVK